MRPKVLLNGGALAPTTLVSVEVVDHAGFENDRLTITIDDRKQDTPILAKNTQITVEMGYEADSNALSLHNGVMQFMGTFFVDEVDISKVPALVKIHAHANFMGNTFKSMKDRDWHEKTVADIVGQIAGEHGFTPRVDPELGAKFIEHIEQEHQSDMAFLTLLGKRVNGVAKVTEGFLYFGKKGNIANLSGDKLAPVTVREVDCSNYHFHGQARSEFTGSIGRYWDYDKAEEVSEVAGSPENARLAQHDATNAEDAYWTAEADAEALNKERETINFTAVGNPLLMAESPVTLVGFRAGITTIWVADSVTHTYTSSGYTTRASCKLPE